MRHCEPVRTLVWQSRGSSRRVPGACRSDHWSPVFFFEPILFFLLLRKKRTVSIFHEKKESNVPTVVLNLTQKISAISCPSRPSLPPERSLRSAHRLSVQLHSKTNACGPMRTSAPTKSIVNAPTSIRRKSRARLWSIERVRGNHPKGFPGLFFLLPGVFFLEKQKENAVRFPFSRKEKEKMRLQTKTGNHWSPTKTAALSGGCFILNPY